MKQTPGNIIILHMCTINDNHMIYGSWDMKHDRQDFLSFWTVFLPFYPTNNPKYQDFEKLKKTPGDIIILDMCTINYNHMMYGSWDIEHDRQSFLSLWTIFCSFTSLKTPKIKILKKWNERLEILPFYTSVPWIIIIWCMVPEIWNVTYKIFCHFGPFFAILPH